MTDGTPTGGYRIGEAERDQSRAALGAHLQAGRLDPAEYDERMQAVSAARVVEDLRASFADLPLPRPDALGAPHPSMLARPAWGPPAQPAPHGYELITGRPYSEKEKLPAGLLQIFLGCFGVGRFFIGHNGIGLIQLLLTVLTLGTAAPITFIWGIVDGVLMLTGKVTDKNGRPLR